MLVCIGVCVFLTSHNIHEGVYHKKFLKHGKHALKHTWTTTEQTLQIYPIINDWYVLRLSHFRSNTTSNWNIIVIHLSLKIYKLLKFQLVTCTCYYSTVDLECISVRLNIIIIHYRCYLTRCEVIMKIIAKLLTNVKCVFGFCFDAFVIYWRMTTHGGFCFYPINHTLQHGS